MAKDDFLSDKEEKFLELVAEGRSIATTCKLLGVSDSTGRVRMHNIRVKFTRAINTKNRILAFGNRNPRLKILLSPIKRENLE